MLKENGYQVIVGTPGRVLDMIANRRAIDPRTIKMFVLDEADEMLSKGFKDGIYWGFWGLFWSTLFWKFIPRDTNMHKAMNGMRI